MGKQLTIDEGWLRNGIWVLICLVILGAALGATKYLSENGPKAEVEAPEVRLDTVTVEEAVSAPLILKLQSQGHVVPRRRTGISAEVGGKLIFVNPLFEAGETFKFVGVGGQPELLLQIDRADYDAAFAAAEATVVDAELALTMEEVRKTQALRDWAKLGNGKEPSDLVRRVPQIASAKAKIKAAKAAQEKAARDIERTEIRVPYDCRIERAYVDEGAVIAPGMPLVDLVSRGAVEVRLPVSLEDYGYLKRKNGRVVGDVTATGLIGGKTVRWNGAIVRSEEMVERTLHSIIIVVRIEPGEAGAPPIGMFVKAEISAVTLDNVIKVPRVAVIDGDKVLLVKDGRLDIRPVEVLRTDREAIIVRGGTEERKLPAGSLIVTTPPNAPVQNGRVQIVDEEGGDVSAEEEKKEGSKAETQSGDTEE